MYMTILHIGTKVDNAAVRFHLMFCSQLVFEPVVYRQ